MDRRNIQSPQEERLLMAIILSGLVERGKYDHELTLDEREQAVANAQLLTFDVIDQSLRQPYPPDDDELLKPT